MSLYVTNFTYHSDHYYLAASETGICFVGSPNAPKSEMNDFIQDSSLIEDNQRFEPYITQLTEYLDGKRTHILLPMDLHAGTEFQQHVWETLMLVPFGQTVTYSELAERCEQESAVRAVASAVAKNPLLMIIPCHRVIHKDGSIGNYRGGAAMKAHLLELEQSEPTFG